MLQALQMNCISLLICLFKKNHKLQTSFMFILYCLSSVISTNQRLPQKYFLMQCLRRFCQWPPRQEYLKVKITQVRTSYGNNWILNGMDFHVALERGALLFIMELSIPNHFWEHVKYWSENKEINNLHSEIETQAYKSSSNIILMWKFMSSNIDCSCMSVAPGQKKKLEWTTWESNSCTECVRK